ncbi:MAG TPA: aspartyl protease family protein [Steroidobacteraceae bacterium]|nr:aspartyl protease family protein [Steroidobacteraceae bacterium]
MSLSPAFACQLQTVGVLHVEMVGNSPLVDVSINGQPARLLIDTGAAASILTRPAAQAYHLQLLALEGVTMYGVGGSDATDRVVVEGFQLGTLKVHDAQFFVAGRGIGAAAGVLGESLLSRWDAEFDFAHGAVRLFQPKGCSGDQVVYWGGSYSVSPLQDVGEGSMIKTVLELNGHKTLAWWDSGASLSTVTTDAARLAGVVMHSDDVKETGQVRGIGSQSVPMFITVFTTFQVGDERIENAKLRIADMFSMNKSAPTATHIARDQIEVPGMLLGADFFHSHRIYVARSQNKVYFSYAGGPVFAPHVREVQGQQGGAEETGHGASGQENAGGTADQPAADQPAADQSAADQSAGDKPGTRPGVEPGRPKG